MHQFLARVFAVIALSIFLIGRASAGNEKAKSPEDTFKAFAAAVKKDDAKGAMSHLTRDSQSLVAGALSIYAWSNMGDEDANEEKEKRERRQAIEKVLKRHGTSKDAIVKWYRSVDKPIIRGLVELGDTVKDKPAFVADILKMSAEVGLDFHDKLRLVGELTIKDVKIDGERAKGQVMEGDTRILFKLENGVWKIDFISMPEEKARQVSPPPPPPPQVQPQVVPSDSRPGLLRRLISRIRGG